MYRVIAYSLIVGMRAVLCIYMHMCIATEKKENHYYSWLITPKWFISSAHATNLCTILVQPIPKLNCLHMLSVFFYCSFVRDDAADHPICHVSIYWNISLAKIFLTWWINICLLSDFHRIFSKFNERINFSISFLHTMLPKQRMVKFDCIM